MTRVSRPVEPKPTGEVVPGTWWDHYLSHLDRRSDGFRVLVEVMCHWRKGSTFIGAVKLAELTDLKRDRVRKILDAAEAGGYLRRTGKQRGRSHERQLCLPAELISEWPEDIPVSARHMATLSGQRLFHRRGFAIDREREPTPTGLADLALPY